MRFLRSPWPWVVLAAIIPVPLLVVFGVPPDPALEWLRVGLFATFGAAAFIYWLNGVFSVLRDGDFSKGARSVVGTAFVIIGIALFQFYGWYAIKLGRPDWLSAQYWNFSIWLCVFVGILLIGSSLGGSIPQIKKGKTRGSWVLAILALLGTHLSPVAHDMIVTAVTRIGSIFNGVVAAANRLF